MWGWGKSRKVVHSLDDIVLYWTRRDVLRVRDLLNGGMLCLGRSGSGKTSGFGRTALRAIITNPNSGGLLLAAKPEDETDVKEEFRSAGRLKDLIIFAPNSSWGFNFLDYLSNEDARNVVQCLMTIGRTLKRGEGGSKEDSAFWDSLNERFLYNAVVALKCAGEPITADRILRFIMSAATSREEQHSEGWRKRYHNHVMERAAARIKSPIEEHDWQLCMESWVAEYPFMDSKTRSNGLAGVMNILHPFNTGLVRQMVSGQTNCSPDDILRGHWVLVAAPPSVYGEVGAFVCAGWKYLTQHAILKRKATEEDPFCVIWADEAHQFVNEPDSYYIAQCRSHKGCLVYLSQSVSSFYAALKGEAGKHQVDALLANFSYVCIHACDPMTAKWASAKLGRKRQMLFSGSTQQHHDMNIWEQCFGQNRSSSSFAEHYEQVLQDDVFMNGLKTGGPDNGYLCEAIIIRNGIPFSAGESYLRTSFNQRG